MVKLSNEHDDFAWISRDDLMKYDLMQEEIAAIKAVFES